MLTAHDLEDDEYKAAHTLLRELAAEWNAGHRDKIDKLGLIILDRERPAYEELRRFFLSRVKGVPPAWLHWDENLEYLYSEAELTKYAILELLTCPHSLVQ